MCYEEVACPRCSSLNVKKNGTTGQQKQRYRCQDCKRQFITDYTYQAYKPEVPVFETSAGCCRSAPTRCSNCFVKQRRRSMNPLCPSASPTSNWMNSGHLLRKRSSNAGLGMRSTESTSELRLLSTADAPTTIARPCSRNLRPAESSDFTLTSGSHT